MSRDRLPRWRDLVARPAPKGWRKLRAGEVFLERNEVGVSGLMLLSVTRERGVVRREEIEKRDTSSSDKSRYKRVLRGDIAYNTMRMWQGVSGLCPVEGIVSPAYTVLVPQPGFDGEFLSCLLKFSPLIHQFHAYSQGLVDDTLSLKYEKFASIPLLVAPLTEQRKIATILSSVDETIERIQAVIDQLKVVKQAMMQELLTHGIPGRHTRFKQTEVGEIPEEWEVDNLGSVSLQVTDGEHKTPRRTQAGVLLLSARNVLNGRLALDDVDHVDEKEYARISQRCRPGRDDILISCSGTIGRVCRVPAGLRFGLVRSVAMVRPDKVRIRAAYLEHVLRSPVLQDQMQLSKKQAAQANLFQGAIRGLSIPIPSIREQEEISSALGAVDDRLNCEGRLATAYGDLKSSLMSILLTGEVRVKLDEDVV